jgi:two-component system OmpR family sensor kinase
MSLRTRLLAGLVVLTAAGLLAAGFATYRAERSFLFGRVDSQVLASVRSVQAQVDLRSGLHRGLPGGAAPLVPGAPIGSTDTGDSDSEGRGDVDTRPPGNYPGGVAGLPLEELADPPGTFGEYINVNGKRVGGVFAVGSSGSKRYLPPPDLPAHFPRSSVRRPRLFTVSAVGEPSLEYRVLAISSDAGPGTTIVAVSMTEIDASLSRLRHIEAIVIGSVLLALAICAWLLIRVGLRPLDRIGATAGAIAAGDLSQRVSPSGGRTEIGRLGLALNAMLGQIEQAFARRQASEERLRRFLSDASHELRTPLTSIRGYAELFRIGATSTPADTRKAMARIEEEATRMGVLVEELLALARLDEMPSTNREPVDLAPLVRDAADDTRAVAPDREVQVSIAGPARQGRSKHIVIGDPHQLRQVLANLTTNALRHTPAGTPIELSLKTTGGVARIEVRDHGPGLPEDSGDAVFERFWRSEPGRERGKAGAGLGLAIVAEIVHAHDGKVSAQNAADGGALFVIELPAGAAGAAGAASPPPRLAEPGAGGAGAALPRSRRAKPGAAGG